MNRSVYIVLLSALSIVLAGVLAGCGTKPNDVVAPDSGQNTRFPRIYPAPVQAPDQADAAQK